MTFPDSHFARRVVAVGKDQHDLAPLHGLQPLETLVDRVPEARRVAEVELVLQQVDQSIAIVDEAPRVELDLVAEFPDLRLVVRQQPQQDCSAPSFTRPSEAVMLPLVSIITDRGDRRGLVLEHR